MSDLDQLLNAADVMRVNNKVNPMLLRYLSFTDMYTSRDKYTFTSLITELSLALFDIALYNAHCSSGGMFTRSTPFKTIYAHSGLPTLPAYLRENIEFILDKYYNWPSEYSLASDYAVLNECTMFLNDAVKTSFGLS